MTRQLRALLVAVLIGSIAMCAPPSAKASLLPTAAEGVGIAGLTLRSNLSSTENVSRPTSSRPFPHADITAPASASFGSSEAPQLYAAEIICSYDWPCGEAMAIVYRESRFDPYAYNPYSGCAGWWQISPIHGYPLSTLFDPAASTAIAYHLWETQGWAPWRVY